ncbi:MAG TPA: M24 family metallopeptidase [Candidatus Omnitrophota bacterium]|nr:M24 family metallopeptidase [Candidatus Omnitrophota bacterium]
MRSRVSSFQSCLDSYHIDAYLVTHHAQVSYLTGVLCEDSWLLVTSRRAYFLTDARYYDEMGAKLHGVQMVLCRALVKDACRLIQRRRLKRVGFDERHISHFVFKQLAAGMDPGVSLVAKNRAVDVMREQKDAEEVAAIRACLVLNKQLFRVVGRTLAPGISEYEILARMERFVKLKKVSFSFPPIVASGPHSAYPHARVTERRLLGNDVLLVDTGIQQDGYKSDLTRMFFLGKITPLARKVYDAVAESQQAAIAKIRPAVPAAVVDREARKYLENKNLDKYFCHSLGHGVGLEIHESPQLSAVSQDILKPGMVVTVEPGVYLQGRFGVRIEDMVLVTDTGCEILSK